MTRADFIRDHNVRIAKENGQKIFALFGAETPELILTRESAVACVRHAAGLGLLVSTADFWCDNTASGCPHSTGSGYNRAGGGFYGECYHLDGYDLEDRGMHFRVEPGEYSRVIAQGNAQLLDYLTRELIEEPFYSPCLCLVLGFPT